MGGTAAAAAAQNGGARTRLIFRRAAAGGVPKRAHPQPAEQARRSASARCLARERDILAFMARASFGARAATPTNLFIPRAHSLTVRRTPLRYAH